MRHAICGILVASGIALTGFVGTAGEAKTKLKGEVKIDGSSTVYLITEAVATNFKKINPDVNISIGISGTGGGFKKFSAGETDINDASRPITEDEKKKCTDNKITYVDLQVGWDGLAVIINKENNWARKMTVAQLKKIWQPDAPAKKWSDVDASWPKETIELYGPGPDSGTFDYFTEVINGKTKDTRTDYHASEDDNIIINGVERNKYALAYVGMAYFEAHKEKLAEVAVAAKDGAEYVLPTAENVLGKKYVPLSRPLFLYVKASSLKRPEVLEFVQYYQRRSDLVSEVKYVPLNNVQQIQQRNKFASFLKTAK